jgi:predicted kinase
VTELVIYRGLPASGKTTAARAWVKADPASRARVNRDDLRSMLHGGYHPDAERYVRVARDRLVKALLDQGVSVACDDTNLSQKVARGVAQIGAFAGATVRVVDLTDVPLEECLRRDFERYYQANEDPDACVGEEVICGMYNRYLAGGRKLAPILADPAPDEADGWYTPRPGTPKAVMVDLDGTLCLHNGRSPYDETLVLTDLPNPAVVETVRAMDAAGYRLVYLTGRSSACAEDTLAWIEGHLGDLAGHECLLMRDVGDRRRDSIVKRELFDAHVRDNYDIAFALDDREQVVRAWRAIGLTVFQVAPGNF